MITKESYHIIDTLIRQGRSFALWRIPGNETIHFRMQSYGTPDLLHEFTELNGRSGFVIAPFSISDKHPIVLIQPDCMDLPEDILETPQDDIEVFQQAYPEIQAEEKERELYTACFTTFQEPLFRGIQDKLVLSRAKTYPKSKEFSAGKIFFQACERYIYSYVYLCYTPLTGIWLGGTPEILLAGEGNQWQTVALAGTQRLKSGKLPHAWDQKNWQEQQLVATYIRRQLGTLGIVPKEKGPYSARAGELAHLKSDFRFTLPDNQKLGDLINLLHPTPAVCGLPKEEAYQFILQHEGYDRSYYSGFIGWLAPSGRTDLYVNLRCMNIHADTYTLFAGGGLLASSRLEEEWNETEDKMKTMRNIIE